jgi:hypothetical protein
MTTSRPLGELIQFAADPFFKEHHDLSWDVFAEYDMFGGLFGGNSTRKNPIFITASTSLYGVQMKVKGAAVSGAERNDAGWGGFPTHVVSARFAFPLFRHAFIHLWRWTHTSAKHSTLATRIILAAEFS